MKWPKKRSQAAQTRAVGMRVATESRAFFWTGSSRGTASDLFLELKVVSVPSLPGSAEEEPVTGRSGQGRSRNWLLCAHQPPIPRPAWALFTPVHESALLWPAPQQSFFSGLFGNVKAEGRGLPGPPLQIPMGAGPSSYLPPPP